MFLHVIDDLFWQYKTSSGGNVIRTDIQVGDDTRRYFPVSIWLKHTESLLQAGSIVLLHSQFHLHTICL